jgi:hypothetical protein
MYAVLTKHTSRSHNAFILVDVTAFVTAALGAVMVILIYGNVAVLPCYTPVYFLLNLFHVANLQ